MIHYLRAVAFLFYVALALGLAVLFLVAPTPSAQAQTQTPTFKIDASYSGLPEVYEGAEVWFLVTRVSEVSSSDVQVEIETWEPNLDDGNGNNPSLQTHRITFPADAELLSRSLSVAAYVDGSDESAEASHVLKARLVTSSDGSYALDARNEAEFTILDPPANVPRISIASDSTNITEGDAASFTLTRTGDTASPLTVMVGVEDPSGFTRGEYWDAPPTLPASVTFAADSSTATVSLQTLDDLRDLPNGSVTLGVNPVRMQQTVPYLLGHTGIKTETSTIVTDNDTAQELELNFGKDGLNDADVSEGDKLAFVVKRRQQDADTGNPATFTVRIETDRSGDDWRLEDWTEDTGTGRLYKDYPLQLAGSDLQVREEFTVTSNGQSESNWDYWASIRPLQHYGGAEVVSGQEAEYWTVKSGFREIAIDATDSGASNGTISIDSDVLTVTEGQAVVYTLYRVDGPINMPVTVQVRTREPNRSGGQGSNPSTQDHDVTIEAWSGHAEFTVYPYVDEVAEAGTDELIAAIRSISQVDGADRYTEGQPARVDVEINDPPSGSTFVTVSANPTSIIEGGSTTVTFTRSGGGTAQPLTANILVDDPDNRLRGNHWDAAPVIPTQVTFAANSTTQSITLTFPDDQRDLGTAGLVKIYVLPGTDYLMQQTGNLGTFTTLSVTDNDTAQELTLKWGRISSDSVHWEEGESYLTCDGGGTCTTGPAEGTFYYDDARGFVVINELEEPHPAHFVVSRRATDTSRTATFVIRVEHNRRWNSARHADWPIDPETGNRYQEFPLTLTGNQRQVVGRVEILDNGFVDHNLWQYSAEIKQIEDAAAGTALSPTEEAQYWTVTGDRKKTIWPNLVLGTLVRIKSVTPKQVAEGQAVTITLERRFGNPLETYPLQVRTWEPNQHMADGTNPTDRVHDVVFPAVPMTDQFVEYVTQTQTLTVATWDDSVYEPRDTFMASLLVASEVSDRTLLLSTKKATILDDDRPTITLSVDDTSITEGDTATFTLTRGNNTANELLVGVSVDDPGGFLEGNFASEAVAVPSSIMFAAGETTREVAIAIPDDWRDIPDDAFTFALAGEPHYDIVGSSSLTVQVADNDVAPQVSISFNHAEVDEGSDLTLVITRTGEDKNPLEIPITAGPVGEEQYHVFGMDAGMSQLHFTYRQPDDSFRGPHHHYTATLHPVSAEFWIPAGATSVNGSILDNDPYTVSVEAITTAVDEGNLLYYRVSHDGHTGEPLRVMANHAETGSAVYDTILGNQTHTVPIGSSSITRGYLTHRNDGYDGDAEFTVELLADDAYEIDGSRSSASIIVRDKDPLPVLGFRDPSTTVGEEDGAVEIWVDLIAAVPPLKTVSVDYSAHDWYSGDGFNIIQHTGTLTFAPGVTSVAVTVEVLQNSIAGNRDRFHVVLTNPVNAALQDGAAFLVHEGVIEDDESVVSLEAQAEAVDEGSDVILTLTRDGNTTDELRVWLQVAKTAPHAENRRDTVVFPAGDATVEHTITTRNDGTRAGSHTVTATLLDPPAIGEPRTYWVGRPPGDTVTVREIDLETVNLFTPTLRVAEGESITLEFARSGASPLTVALEVTETGDYTIGALPETVSFGLREGSATVTIPTENDTTAEDIGKLTVTLKDGTNYRAGWPNSHTFTIYDDDSVKPSVTVTKDQAWVNEGQPVSFTVSRSTPTDNALQARLELNRVRYRVTQADLDDPTRGITTPLNHVHFDTEEITVDFPAGTSSVTVTRQTTDDSLNYGNSTYHATVLNDADDDYVALHNASAKIWVQDDDIPTVTGSSTTSEFYDGRYQVVLPFTRTGDTSGRLPLDYDLTYTGYQPAPLQDETETRAWIKGHGFQPGQATGVSIGDLGYTKALGRSGSLELQSYYCPDNPAACGYYPQYQVGTPSSITYRYYSNTMGVRIKADQASVAEGDPATFTLHRHGGKPDALTRPLEVTVNVTQEGDFISGAAPQTVTFAANQSTATLSVSTTDDGVDETDGAITVGLKYTWSRDCDDEYCYRQKEYEGSPWYVRSVTTAVSDNDYVLPDVSVSDASVDEADGTIEFTVSLSQANIERASSVDWSTAEDGSTTAATSDVDFTAASGTVNFSIGEIEKTVTVTLLDDQLDEVDETFNLVLSNPSELTLMDDTATGTILDDDIGYGIAFSGSTFHTEEGDDVVVSLQRLVPQESGGGVCYVTIQGQCFSVATEGDIANGAIAVNLNITQVGDFLSSPPPTTITFAQGVAAVELSLPTVDDSTVEADGSLSVDILDGASYSPVYIGPPDSQNQGAPFRTLYLYDNDLTFSIDDAQDDESRGQLDFTVNLNGPAPQQVTVDVATLDGEATSHANVTASSLGQDFEASAESLTFAAGEQTKTFSVVILDDTIHEKAETFTVELSTPSQNLNRYNSSRRWSTLTSLADDTAVGMIDDDDQALIASVSRSYSMVDEDHTGPVRFTVELAHPDTTASERNPAVAWRTVSGTAALGADYQGENGKLTFMPGVNIGFIDVDIVDDNLFESALETFSVELVSSDSRLVTVSPTDATFEVSIRDNETLTASIASNAETVAEGNDLAFTVTLTGGVPADDVYVSFETAGDASATDDYTAPKGAITFRPGMTTGDAGVLEISAGQYRGTITFPILADGISENEETLSVEIFGVVTDHRAGSVSATHNIATATILDQNSLTVSIEGSPSVTEGAIATFTITLSTASDQDVSAGWATKQAGEALYPGEKALPDKDYTAAKGTVSIPAGDRSATFTVSTTQDTLFEGAETFVVMLDEATIGNSSPTEMAPLGVTKAEGTIIDDDTAPTGLTISSVSHSEVDEDAGATDITVEVALDGTTQFTVDTPVTVEMIDRPGVRNNATLGVDYTSTTANVTIPAGDASVTAVITLTPVDDILSEDDEVARLSVKSTVFADSVGRGVRIKDNDVEPGEVALTVSPDTVGESVSSLQLTVTGALVGLASRVIDTVVNLELADATATAGEDYQSATATLTIPAGEMSATATMTLTVLDDNIAEGNETLEVTGTVPGTITARPAEVVIEDDDQEPTSIFLLVTAPPVNEGGGAVTIPVRATLLGGGTRSEDTEVTLSVNDVSTTVTDDYTAAWDSPTLTIPAGDFSATANLTLTPVDDTVYEGDEQVAVRGANADPGLPVNGVRLSILDNDPQPTTVTLSLDKDTVLEGSGTHFPMITATLEGNSTLTSDINLTVNLKGYTQRSQSYTAYLFSPLSIEAGQYSGTADLWVIGTDDDVEDEDETVTIEGASDHPDLTVVAAQLTIANDDTSGVRVSPTSLTIREGERKFYSVGLTSEPTSNVVLTVDVPANAGFTVSPGTLTYGPKSWGWKRVYVTGIEDPDADDEPAAEISHSLSSSDTKYAGAASDNVAITVKDITSASVVIAPTELGIGEGGSDAYTVVLDTEPNGDVTITVSGFAGTALSLDKSTLTFTTSDWNVEQTVTVTAGQDDNAAEEIIPLANTVTGGGYDGIVADSVVVTVTDDDTAGVTISETSLDIDEGDSDSYTVVLDTEPVGNVTVTLSGVTGTDLTLDKTTLTFTSGNWGTAQTITVTAEEDDDAVDEEEVTITHTVTSADDSDYDGLTAPSVPVTVTDDDSAGMSISETSLEIEEGDSDTYTVVLVTEPAGNVTVTLGGVTGTDLTLDKTTLTFTSGNWGTAQTITVTAEEDDDAVDEEEVTITHTVTSGDDSDYDGLTAPSVPVTVTDDDSAGVTISETSLDIDEGDSETYTVVLATEPVGDVTVTIDGVTGTDLSLDKTTLTFTTPNWGTAQTITVTAEEDDDAVDEEEVTITHTVSSSDDTQYDGVAAGNVAVTVTDDEVPAPDITLTMEPPTHGDTDGDGDVNLGDTLTYRAVADNTGNVPLENVRIRDVLVHTSGTDCGILRVDAICTVTAEYTIVQSDVEAGSVTNTATTTADGVADKTVTRETSVDQVEGLELEKTSAADGFDGTGESISYNYRVTNTGTVSLSGTLEIADDKIASGDITCPSVPGGGIAPGAFLTCTGSYTTVQDDVDAAKVTNKATATLGGVTSGSDSVTVNWRAPLGSQPQLSVSSGEDDEDAGSFTFTVTLNPSSLQTVTVDYATTNGTATSGADYTATSGSLTFSPGDTTKSVTVTIEDDDVDEYDETFTLTLSDAVNASIPIPTGTSTIRDDDTAGVTVSDTSLDIDEGDSDTYTVVLDSQPTNAVTVTINDPTNTDVTADPADLTFTPSNWDTAQTVMVTASQDSGHGDEDGTVTHTVASSDTKYDGISVSNVLVNVTDDDDVPVAVSFDQSSYTVAEGSSVSIKVTLSADPERTVEVPITVTTIDGADAADFSGVPASVVFNSGDTEKTFDFEATDDTVDDDGERVRLTFGTIHGSVTSTSPSQAVVSIRDDDDPEVTVSFEQATYTVAEGSTVTVKVVLSANPERSVTIPFTATGQGGATASDYSVPASVVFSSGDTEKTIDFVATDDATDDDGESVKLGFGTSLPPRVTNGSPDEAVVSITDDDDPAVTVRFEQATYIVAEGGTVTVKVKLSADPERTVTIPLTKTNEDGATGSDYSGVPANVVFNSGDTEKTFGFSAASDNVDDDDESVRLGFGSSLPSGVTTGSPGQAVVTITDDDDPSVTVSFEQGTYTVAEGSTVAVKVTLSADPERTVTIPLLRLNQDGATSADYSGVPQNVVFNSGDTEKTFEFEAIDDAVDDDGESVRVSFGALPDQVSTGTHSGTTVSISDDDVPSVTVSFQQASYTVAEGGTVTVKVKLSADPERTVTIPVTATGQGGATASDYNVPASIVFNSGDTEKTFTFAVTQDAEDDDGESVELGFGPSLPTGVTKGSPDEAVVSITDDDDPAVTVRFASATYSVDEGDDQAITIKLSADPERTVAIMLSATPQGGASNSDYTLGSTSVTFSSGETTKTVTFSATPDSADDDDESVRIGFINLPSRVTAGTPDETVVSIVDDDDPPVTVSFEQATYTVAEGSSVTVKVKLSADPERTVEVPITATDMGGASSSDYSIAPQTVVFNSGDTEKTFSFSATDDAEDDDGEQVRLNFGSLPSRVSSTGPSQAVVSIRDDDVPEVTVSFEQASYTVVEGATVTVKVTLSANPERMVIIPLTATNEGGASNSDYSSLPSSVTFNGGEAEKTFDFEATDDTVDDDGESVRLGFGSSLPTGVTEGSPDEAVVSITDDDDPAVTVRFASATYSVAEGSNVTVKVKLSADPERTVTIPLTKAGQGGATGSDYSGVPANVVFNSGDTEKTFEFEAEQDTVDDDGESVRLGFGSSLPDRVSAGTPDEAVVSINDDDDPTVTVSFGQPSYTVAEGNSVSIKVKLSTDPERTVTIPLTRTNQGGASNSDYSNVPGQVVFNSGDTEKTFNFTATDDSADDDGESVKLGFDAIADTLVSASGNTETTVNITDDDVASVNVSFEQASYTVAEGASVTVKVKLSADPARTVTIPLNKSNQGGASSSDYSGVPANVVFNSGDTEKTFAFEATQDTVDDDGESVKLTFGASLPTGVSEGAIDEMVINIDDDDVPSVTVSFGQPSYTVAEGASVTVKVKLSADPERTVTVPLTKTNMDGAAASDYSGVPASVVFNSGDTEKTFDFEATQDTSNDDGEGVRLTFGTLPGRVSSTSPSQAVVSITDDDFPSVTVSFDQDTYSVIEGESVTVTVTLSADPERTVTIPITATNQDDASSDDYSVPSSVVFNSGETEKTFDFEATDDDEDDNDETVKLSFGGLPTAMSEGTTNETVVSILDNDGGNDGHNKVIPVGDLVPVTVNFEQASYAVAEGNSVTVKVTLDQDPERTVTIPLSKTDQGGISSADHSTLPASVEFDSGNTEKTFSFTATQDTVDDDGESVKVGFGELPDGVTEGTTNETTISITDDDVPSVTVSFDQATYTVAEGSSVTVKVKLSSDPERTVNIPLTRTNQGGASSSDYSSLPTSVTFNSGQTTRNITFSAASDSDNDDGESVKLGIGSSLPTGVTKGSPDESIVSITNDDVPSVEVSFEQSSYTVAEGGSVSVKVKLDADPERTVTIPVTKTNQGGASSSDYSNIPANVVFNSGDTEKTFDFEATQDTTDDDGESVRLGFGTLPTGVSEGTTNESTVSITDDDVPSVTVSFGNANYSVAEGSSITVKVKLSADPERSVEVPITVTTLDGAESADFSGVPASVVFGSGDMEKTFDFEATDDTVDDDGKRVRLTFGTLPGRVNSASPSQAVISIADDDVPDVTVSFEQATYTVAEGSSVTMTVELSAAPERTVTIPLLRANQGGATSADYSGVPQNVVFNNGETEKTFDFEAIDDEDDDDGESVRVSFGTLPDQVSSGTNSATTVSITDDDETTQNLVSVHVSFQTFAYALTEGWTTDVTVTLSADPERNVSIPLTATNGTGTTSGDYSGVPPSVDFASGETQKSFTLTAEQDDIDEDAEQLTLAFDTLPEGVSTGTNAQVVVTINDSIHVSFDTSYYEAYEGGDGAVVTVQMDNAPALETVIPITATGMNGATSSDWTGVPDSLTFSSGQTSNTFTVMAYDDTVEDDGETVGLGFGTLPPGVARGNPNTATVELMNMEVNRYMCPSDAGDRIILDSVGDISVAGESDFWRVKLDPRRLYIVEVLGKDGGVDIMNRDTYPGDLTLEDPLIAAFWDDGRNMMRRTGPGGSDDGGIGRNSFNIAYGFTPSGWQEIEVQGKGGTGTYQIKVRINNVCNNVNGEEMYPWAGGPDGYAMDAPANASTRMDLMSGYSTSWTAIPGYLGDNWSWYRENEADVDWVKVHLKTDHEYTIELWTNDEYATEYQAHNLKILGIYDKNGALISGTASGSGKKVSITFEPDADGKYYIAVGSAGSDRTGVYQISAVGRNLN